MQLTDAAHTLNLSDEERDQYLGGLVNFVFFAVGAPASILVWNCFKNVMLAFE